MTGVPLLGGEAQLEEALKRVGVLCPGCGETTDLAAEQPADETFPALPALHVWEFLFLHPTVGGDGIKIRAERVYACGRQRQRCGYRFGLLGEMPAGFRPSRAWHVPALEGE
jgi:hypothetical protein